MFLPVFLGAMLGGLSSTCCLLLYTHVRDKLNKREYEAYKQELLDVLKEPQIPADAKRGITVVRKAGTPRSEN